MSAGEFEEQLVFLMNPVPALPPKANCLEPALFVLPQCAHEVEIAGPIGAARIELDSSAANQDRLFLSRRDQRLEPRRKRSDPRGPLIESDGFQKDLIGHNI